MLTHPSLGKMPFFTDYEIPAHVQGYDPDLGTNTYCTIRGALLYEHPYTGQTYPIVIHLDVEIPDLKHHMLCPLQFRTNGVTVIDCPILLTYHPTEETHAIISDIKWGNKVVLPLWLSGVTSYLSVRSLTENEWNQQETPQVTLMNKHLT